ncbi:myozenin-3 [Equus przewalskii]|uniref:Myozenin 3 n=2 Tax=Equus TaxID=9789 RepID=A0A9L0T8Z0_HORSE|nr:myozenin-3 [Equus caballus]XP_008515453.1 PREDICTED: myozenin-3 [Equus przewalskii]XP_008515455.1 PREDICTED: myozenin-3 [Equus przewalskii]XP_008515456.1 PREDICTED: myozenin-3 [Equus przewalskii]XP_008515457.1 PREDICTED: myozenin-3 [Equus przewalskii]XP_014586060.1 myozenin-3 [Equus caballus]XP_014586061.1 myozenin-3 [Equus caballus]XP_023473174.1 myozenin-3 [Equus caballus]XP_023473175.1 myozenin-3 [Equus caballus]
MIPKEQKGPVMAAMEDLAGPVPVLDLGKKLSVPQDLMMEELSLRNNRGSLLFQKRQRRVQKFTFEFAASQRATVAGSAKGKVPGAAEPGTVTNGPEGQNYRSELHIFPASPGGPEDAQPAASGAKSARSPSALAPGYAEPLKSVPPEKFNHTAIPKGYRCPWQEFISYRDYQSDGRSHTPSPAEYRNFNKTPVPFGGPLVGEAVPRAGTSFIPELTSGLELLRLRPSFNRVAQGWVRNLPESEDL